MKNGTEAPSFNLSYMYLILRNTTNQPESAVQMHSHQ